MNLYEADLYHWTQDTADRLRHHDFTQIDLPALIEEVEDLGKRQKSARFNSPSLRPFLSDLLAIKDTGLDKNTFAPTCPYSLAQILTGKE